MTLTYLGIGIGQQLLNVGDIQGQTLFIIAGVIFALCLVPVSATGGVHPSLPETKPYHFISIFRRAPLGMLGSMAAGLTNSAFYAMMPVVCTDIGLTLGQLSWIMTITVFSGLAAQWAFGTLFDRFDRTVVITGIATAIAVVSGFMLLIGERSFGGMAAGMVLLGALMFAVYPVSVARAHDVFGGQDVVAVSAGLLFAYSIGACVSPLLASGVMTLLDAPFGLFAFWFLINGIYAAVSFYLRRQEKVEIVSVEDQVMLAVLKPFAFAAPEARVGAADGDQLLVVSPQVLVTSHTVAGQHAPVSPGHVGSILGPVADATPHLCNIASFNSCPSRES